ncbi:MAG: hypothetical protein WDM78_17175 [Puia sp.]
MARNISPKTDYSICSSVRPTRMNLRYQIIHLKGDDIEVAITHNSDYGEEIFSL